MERLRKKIRKLEAALNIVADHSGKAESRMRKQFEVVSETLPVPMVISDENDKIVFANLSAQKIFAYGSDHFSKLSASSLYDNPDDKALFLETLSDKGEVSGFRTELRKADGSVFPAVLFSQPIYFDVRDCILTVVHDLTEVMALEKQLRHIQKMEAVGTLASGIAHDFNNILSAIFGYTTLVANALDPEKNEKEKGYLDNVMIAGRRAKGMIMQMMAFCRQSEKEREPFHIASVVSEVVKMICNLTRSDIDIRPDIRDKDMLAMGIPPRYTKC